MMVENGRSNALTLLGRRAEWPARFSAPGAGYPALAILALTRPIEGKAQGPLVDQQIGFAHDVVTAANARYAGARKR